MYEAYNIRTIFIDLNEAFDLVTHKYFSFETSRFCT